MATRDLTCDGSYVTKHGTRGKRAIYLCNKVVSGVERPRPPVKYAYPSFCIASVVGEADLGLPQTRIKRQTAHKKAVIAHSLF